jgi:branched-chain amino acid aminotransferase
VFEGARCYKTPKGSMFFRLGAHMRRLYDSARIYRMDYALDCETMTRGVIDTVIANGLEACYIRPLIYRGYNTLGVNPLPCPIDAVILVWEWGAYLGPRRWKKAWTCA